MDNYEYVDMGHHNRSSVEKRGLKAVSPSQKNNPDDNHYESLRLGNQPRINSTIDVSLWRKIAILLGCICLMLMVGMIILIVLYASVAGQDNERGASHMPNDEDKPRVSSSTESITQSTTVTNAQGEEDNLALHKPAWQSSTFAPDYFSFTRVAAVAVDGDTNGDSRQGSCTHTHSNTNAWWMVDLRQEYDITGIDIYKRIDSNYEVISRLKNFYVGVYLNTPPEIPTPGDYQVCYLQEGVLSSARTSFHCNADVSGRYVIIQFNNYVGILELCEVVVKGTLK